MSDLTPIIDDLIAAYAQDLGDRAALAAPASLPPPCPSKPEIRHVLDEITAAFFPDPHTGKTLGSALGRRCRRIDKTLSREIAKSLLHLAFFTGAPLSLKSALCQGKTHSLALLRALPGLKRCLDQDAQAAYRGDPAAGSLAEIRLSYPGFHAIVVHRIAHFLYTRGVPLIPRMMSEDIHSQTGIDIHPGATIGASFFIDHGTGVVIGETTVIGAHVKLYQGVTLGALSLLDRNAPGVAKRHPTIEDHVTIYAGATILGGDTVIGEGSIVGGNVWLTQSVPPHTKILNKAPYLIYQDLKTGQEKRQEKELDLEI